MINITNGIHLLIFILRYICIILNAYYFELSNIYQKWIDYNDKLRIHLTNMSMTRPDHHLVRENDYAFLLHKRIHLSFIDYSQKNTFRGYHFIYLYSIQY